MPRHRSVERHALRVAAGACALLLASIVSATAGEGEAEVVARVNGTPITQGTVNQVVKSLILERGSTPNSDEIKALNDAALDSLIDLELLFAAAQQAQIRVTDQDVQAARWACACAWNATRRCASGVVSATKRDGPTRTYSSRPSWPPTPARPSWSTD